MQKILVSSSKNKKGIILSIKKNKLLRQVKKINVGNRLLISRLIEDDVLDSSIINISNKCICSNNKPVLKKEYVDSYNHYIYILDNFIHYFYNIFNFNIDLEEIIRVCLKENSDVLLCDKYVFDNDNIKYYRTEYNKIVTGGFYYNITVFKDELEEYLNNFPIDIQKININNEDDSEKILNLLKDIYLTNREKHMALSLFIKVTEATYKFYLDGFEFMFYIYFNKKKNKS